jgi:hypothetical protein
MAGHYNVYANVYESAFEYTTRILLASFESFSEACDYADRKDAEYDQGTFVVQTESGGTVHRGRGERL